MKNIMVSSKKAARKVVEMRKVKYREEEVTKDIVLILTHLSETLPKECWEEVFTREVVFKNYNEDMQEIAKDVKIINILLTLEILKNFKENNPKAFDNCVRKAISHKPNLKIISRYLLGRNPALFAISEVERSKYFGRKKSRFEQGVDFCRSHPRFTVKWYKFMNRDDKAKYDHGIRDKDLLEKIIDESRSNADPFIQVMIKTQPYRQFRKYELSDEEICALLDEYEEHLKKEQK